MLSAILQLLHRLRKRGLSNGLEFHCDRFLSRFNCVIAVSPSRPISISGRGNSPGDSDLASMVRG